VLRRNERTRRQTVRRREIALAIGRNEGRERASIGQMRCADGRCYRRVDAAVFGL